MVCTIYTPEELCKKRSYSKDRVVVLARFRGGLILVPHENSWALPETSPVRGESMEETAQRALGAAMGEAVFGVRLLSGFTVTGPDGREAGGYAFLADVETWPDEGAAGAEAFDPLPEEIAEKALVYGLRRWAWPFFLKTEGTQRLI